MVFEDLYKKDMLFSKKNVLKKHVFYGRENKTKTFV